MSLLCEETDAPFLENVQNSNLSKLKPKPKLKPFKTQTLLDLFLFSDAGICSTMAFPPLGNSYHVVVSVSIDFPSNSQRNAPLHGIAYDYSRGDWDGLCDHLRDIPLEDIFKLGAFAAAASKFCEWFQVGIDIYIFIIKNIKSSLTHLHGFQLLVLQL